ncbi:DEAD/DEAH box helicase [Halochromatium salexigens]|uniref:ATP-dependent RNA helicase DeaD n=1 Tax=Halochromatium salexigens TaxID=49447 RepID=A0AAJ0UI17_HALSE|nr:DEAD/DEAH box helicase [Halochromatium salexigens]MBK5931878.1 ATP-dependent RNA helicase [Halochromatium salexigens]
MSDSASTPSFADLGLPPALLSALDAVGYETPSPIQAATIPHLLAGSDLLGHAPTGTGKTAAFALPLLARIDLAQRTPQVLVLTPTRELALQVAEACQRYASALGGFQVLPIYGGSDYGGQIRQLKRGVHLVVGTPGRIMDHMRKGTLRLDALQALVLDEADEMLRMGFIDDVEWILEQTPAQRQIALFSATLPSQIQRIAQRHLNQPQSISIEAATATAETIRQRYWLVSGMHKLDALTRILEVEPFEGLLLFVRTKTATTELATRLGARGWTAAALNGDMPQQQREQMVDQLRSGALDILVATDVAARGLDVERISHVVNYDIPYDTEAYIHRIGRTGRAGRTGEAILFVAPRERRMLAAIERATRQRIEPLTLPSTETVNNKRIADFKQRITDTLAAGELGFMQGLIEQYQEEHDVPAVEIAAALAKLSIGDQPLLLTAPERPERERPERGRGPRRDDDERPRQQRRPPSSPDQGMERFRIAVGHRNGVKPGNIVGAIANEAGLDARHIGRIDIHEEFSLVDLPTGMPRELLQDLRKVRVCGRALDLTRSEPGAAGDAEQGTERPQRPKGPRSGPPGADRARPAKKPAKKNR